MLQKYLSPVSLCEFTSRHPPKPVTVSQKIEPFKDTKALAIFIDHHKKEMLSLRTVSSLLLLLVYFKTNTAAFTVPSKQYRNLNGVALGPVARNGLAYEDVALGQGRRILPGDTVYCYYIGSFKKGAFGGPTVFDQISTSECFLSLFGCS